MAKYAIGLDVGGTKIHSIVAEWDKDFLRAKKIPKILESKRTPVQNKKDGTKFFNEIITEISLISNKVGKKNVARVGVGVAGPLSKEKVILNPGNLPFNNFPILAKLKESFKLPVFVDNDANCFAWAEHLFGAAKNASSSVGITLGTGVGAGIVLTCGGKPFLWDGYYGGAGEVGHMILDGNRTFEQLCSSRAEHLWKGRAPLEIEQNARAGAESDKEVYREFGFWLGVGIANLINIVEPEIVVIGGGLSNSWDLFEQDMLQSVETHVSSALAKKTKIVRAKLGDDAGALGAAYLQ